MTLEAAGLQLAPAPRRAGPGTPAATERPANHGAPGSAAVLASLRVLLPLVLAGYALFDRGFALLHVPGITVYSGEVLLALGLVAAVLATGHFRVALHRRPTLALVLVFCGWGLARTIPFVRTYGIDALRDSALWYYSLTAVLVFALLHAFPGVVMDWIRRYAVFLIILLLWTPAAVFLARNNGGPVVPGSDVPVLSHKVGNSAVAAVTALAFLWLVPTHRLGRRARSFLTVLAILIILAIGTQNRGSFLAALIAITFTIVLARRRRRQLTGVILATAVLSLVLSAGLNVHVVGGQGREVSAAQLVTNIASVAGGSQNTGQLGSTVEFRNELWSGVLNLARENGAMVTGLGFGRNLALDLGLQGQASDPLRSPHNSHLDVLARMGVVGGVLWLAIWLSWYSILFRRLRVSPGFLTPTRRGLMGVCLVGVTATLVNAYFDPTLESPQVALWLWTLVGLGLALASPPPRGASPVDGTGELTSKAEVAMSADAGRPHPTTPPVLAGSAP